MVDSYLLSQNIFFLSIDCSGRILNGYGQKKEELAFQESKKLLTSSTLLVHFNPSLLLILSHDGTGLVQCSLIVCRMVQINQ